TPVAIEVQCICRTGEPRFVSWRFSTAKDARTNAPSVIVAGLDIDDQKKLEDQLRHAQKMETLGTLVGGIAHDFNNQLTIVLGNVRLALQELPADCSVISELTDAALAGQRCADMTEGLLTFSQRRVGRVGEVKVGELIGEASRLLHRLLPPTITISSET